MEKTEKKEVKKGQSKRTLQGIVRRVIDERSASVVVEKVFPNPLYKRLMKKKKTYLVNVSEGVEISAGDTVTIKESQPVSKRKCWAIVSESKKE